MPRGVSCLQSSDAHLCDADQVGLDSGPGFSRVMLVATYSSSCSRLFGRLAVPTPAEGVPARSHTQGVQFLLSLGRDINIDMSSLTPSQSFEYGGLAVRTDPEVVCPAVYLLAKLQPELTTFTSQIFITPRNFHSLLGLLNFLAGECR